MLHELFGRQMGGLPPMPPPSPEYLAENIAPKLMAVEGPLFALSTAAVLMRFYVRIFMLKTFGWDDAMMALAACISITTLGLFLNIIHLGLGLHAQAFPLANMPPFFKIMYFYSILIIFAYSFIKLSIGFFLLRLADRTRWRPFLIGMLVFLGVFTIGSTFAIIFQCWPVSAGYDFSQRPPSGTAKCYDPTIFKNVGVFNSSVNIATDLIFALIPIPMVWKLQVTVRTRIGLGVILSLGLFAFAVAIYKTPMQANFFKETDWSGHGAWYYIWQQVEMHIGIIAACLPTIKPLFSTFSTSLRTLSRGRTTGSTSRISVPFRASGYVRQTDRVRGRGSFALKNLSGASSRSRIRDPYDEDNMLGLGKEVMQYEVEAGADVDADADVGVDVDVGEGGRRRIEIRGSVENDSELWEQDGWEGRRSVSRGMTIVKTTEVPISR